MKKSLDFLKLNHLIDKTHESCSSLLGAFEYTGILQNALECLSDLIAQDLMYVIAVKGIAVGKCANPFCVLCSFFVCSKVGASKNCFFNKLELFFES